MKCHIFASRMKKISAIILLLALAFLPAGAHGSWKIHVIEMYSVLPFEADENGSPTKENKAIGNWLKTITSELIDGYKGIPTEEFGGLCFYDYLRYNFDFHCKHRLLFHWGFNARPWNPELEKKVSKCSWRNCPDSVELFKRAFVLEQKRRNARANSETEKVFGYSYGGKEASWANGIISIAYDVHLLGDYVLDDNRDFDGVTPPSQIAGDIVSSLRKIDKSRSKPIEKEITSIAKSTEDEHVLASHLIALLQEKCPKFLLDAQGGSLKRRWVAQGYRLK